MFIMGTERAVERALQEHAAARNAGRRLGVGRARPRASRRRSSPPTSGSTTTISRASSTASGRSVPWSARRPAEALGVSLGQLTASTIPLPPA